MPGPLGALRRLAFELPRNLKLSYCLVTDPRLPVWRKAAFGGAMTLVLTPVVNLPEWIPVVGEADVIALSLIATKLFISTAPEELVAEHERLLRDRDSRFDHDVEAGRRMALLLAGRVRNRSAEVHALPAPSSATESRS